jgi:hypothetical protein
LGLVSATVLASGCATPPPPPEPLDAGRVALVAESRTQLDRPARIVFQWSMSEQGVRFSGRGIARIEPPYRARLDLFLPGGETIARAALVGDDLRIPPGVPEGMIPPGHLLWGTLGVFRPGIGSALLGGEDRGSSGTMLRYGFANGDEIRYHLAGVRIRQVELLRGGHVVQSVELEMEDEGRYPVEARFRELGAFRELTLSRESVEYVESYPPDIWNPTR